MSVKVATYFSFAFLLAVLVYFGVVNNNSNDVSGDSHVVSSPPKNTYDTEKTKTSAVVPIYKVLHEGTSYCDYEILMEAIDLNSTKYKNDVQAILDDIARKFGRTRFIAWILDDANAARLNYSDLENGNRLSRAETDFVNYHVVAVYSSGFSGEGRYYISYFENVPADKRNKHLAWEKAYNENDINIGYTPKM